MPQNVDVMVVGGGVVGLSAAIAMKARGFSVGVMDVGTLERSSKSQVREGAPMTETNVRVYAINQASQMLLQTLGVWSKLDIARISPYTHMHVWDAISGAHIDFDARLVGTDRLGSIIEENVIKQALLSQALIDGVMLFPNCPITKVCPLESEVLVYSHAQPWQAKLLIVADGPLSTTRDLLNVPVTTWPYHQQAIIANVRTQKSHQQTAYQVFRSDGPLAFLPLVDKHESSIVWSTSHARANGLMALSDHAFQQQVTHAFAEKLGEVTVLGKRHQFPLNMRHAKCYSGPSWLLMGDAAHTIHPLAGLGLNIGLADLAAWLTLLDANKHPIWSHQTLGAYQRQRKSVVWQQIGLMEGLKALFANPLPPIAMLRGLGLNACNRLPFVKRLCIEHAAGGVFPG